MERLPRIEMIYDMLQQEPQDVFLNYAMAMEHLSNADLIKAEDQFHKTLELNKEYLPCYYQIGQLKEKLNDPETAITYYKQGIELARQQGNTKAMGELNEALWMLED
jgi:tetratricopeptide (TPR) repeat protein